MKKILVFSIFVFISCAGFTQRPANIGQFWETFEPQSRNIAREVLKCRDNIAKHLKGCKQEMQTNRIEAVRYVAKHLKAGDISEIKPSEINKLLKGIDLTSPEIIRTEDLSGFIEGYFGLKYIAAGAPAEEAWGSMWFNTTVETLGNEYDYKRYRDILETGNPALISTYLECLRRVFRYNGYTHGLENIRPLVEKNFPEGELKEEILKLYTSYHHLKEGAPAPSFTLKDFKNREHSLSDYKGKVVVVDVWATWCGGCILKLPEFLKMREAYKNREDIEFITISIDKSESFNTWKYSLPRLKLMELTNLLAPDGNCSFGQDYRITGVPRYFLFDRQGNIVSAYAPSPGDDFKKLIDKTLMQKN
ncbi:MAG: TlpA family protein disulfide reductase [Odoribacter sp.]|nr:TlpA family protein disulfide reductase [Odoribacter sp.]